MTPAQVIAALRQANEMARRAVAQGKHPFGAVLIAPDGDTVLMSQGNINTVNHAEATLIRAAAEKYEAVRPGHKVYGANLYLTAFDADGLPFDLVDHRGEPLSITIEAKSGELVKPALTAEGEARRQKAKEEARRQAEEAAAEAQRRHRQTLDEYEQERQKRRKKELQNFR